VGWEWSEVINTITGAQAWALRARVAGGQAKLCLNEPLLYLDSAAGVCGPAEATGLTMAQVKVLVDAPPMHTQAMQKHQLAMAERLGVVPMPPVLEPMALLAGLPLKACLHLSLTPLAGVADHGFVKAELRFDYAGHKGWWTGQGPRVTLEAGGAGAEKGRSILERDPAAELEFISQLMQWGLSGDGRGNFGIPARPESCSTMSRRACAPSHTAPSPNAAVVRMASSRDRRRVSPEKSWLTRSSSAAIQGLSASVGRRMKPPPGLVKKMNEGMSG